MTSKSQVGMQLSLTVNDEVYTPADALDQIIPHLDKKLTYYDCTSNTSHNILNYLRDNGFTVLGSEGRDFLVDDLPDGVDVILTNPPYSIKDDFIARCYELGKPWAMLMPVNTVQGKKRGAMFMRDGLEMLVINHRVKFTEKGSPSFGVAWFCNDVLPDKLMFSGAI